MNEKFYFKEDIKLRHMYGWQTDDKREIAEVKGSRAGPKTRKVHVGSWKIGQPEALGGPYLIEGMI
jgi:hypothetical protein